MLVELKHAQKHYNGFSMDCSIHVKEGSVTGLIGANGAGKSTTFKAILGLIKTDGGTVSVLGKDAEKLTPEDRREIGTVLSDSGFSGYFSVKELLSIMENFYPGFDREEFTARCKRFSLPIDKKIKEFSTGMKAKLKVLLAISYDARLLILDEPTAGLDVVARDEILDILREYMELEGRAILISSHISKDLEGLCDDIYMIDKGSIMLHEETDTIMDQYGVLKVDGEIYGKLDKKYILRVKQESYGYSCLTNERSYYAENYPSLVIEKGSVDEVIAMMVKGEKL